jgi:hypothetical protein
MRFACLASVMATLVLNVFLYRWVYALCGQSQR